MSLIDNMAAAIHGIKEKYPEPPQTQIKMHPDDFRAVADPVIAACQRFKNIVLYGFKLAEIEPVGSTQSANQRVRAKSFLAGIMKRERPVVMGSWRMCPST